MVAFRAAGKEYRKQHKYPQSKTKRNQQTKSSQTTIATYYSQASCSSLISPSSWLPPSPSSCLVLKPPLTLPAHVSYPPIVSDYDEFNSTCPKLLRAALPKTQVKQWVRAVCSSMAPALSLEVRTVPFHKNWIVVLVYAPLLQHVLIRVAASSVLASKRLASAEGLEGLHEDWIGIINDPKKY